ncbi:conserved hypothetical protein [Exiguobacterium sp. 8H]|uniref:hypothetical protein n=1 Tax=unclassified Exiguobacterium TaxID=2644629 RepID=UPI0012F2FADF|nr:MULTISPECIES: hypothetical protein [unclassified Exiguobacterium]VXB82573.1 conserved hypothetical protein [Exiguobacterium sp. 8H]VXC04752.1 conserved hypothetical protein [Exiguobacterium sp. 8A]
MHQTKVARAIKERMEEVASERGTTLHAVLREMRANPKPSETPLSSRPPVDIDIVYHYCARLDISLTEFFRDDRFR